MAFLPIGVPDNPAIEVCIDWTNDPTSGTKTWTDITPYVKSYSRTPVRTNEFDQPGPASATLELRNGDARFTPDNTAGPYYGGLKKYRRIRVRAQWAGVIYNRFFGYVQDWPQTWASAGKDQTVTIQCSDGLFPLVTADLQGHDYAAALSGAQLADILQSISVSPLGTFDNGVSTIADSGVLPTKSFALQRCKDICATEMGFMYADGGGTIQFHDRHHRLTNAASTTVQATIGDTAGTVRYIDPDPQYGDVWPIVQVTPLGASTPQVATTTAATNSYFHETLNYPTAGSYLVSSASEALSAAQYLFNRYSSPITRVDRVVALGVQDTATWPTLLSLDTSDLVTFQRHFLVDGTAGGLISLSQFVEGYGDQVVVGSDWRVSLAMSPADTQKYWLAGDPALSLAGETTRGGY